MTSIQLPVGIPMCTIIFTNIEVIILVKQYSLSVHDIDTRRQNIQRVLYMYLITGTCMCMLTENTIYLYFYTHSRPHAR